MQNNFLYYLALIILIIGGLNWGFVALFDQDLVKNIFKQVPALINPTYILVALSAIYIALVSIIRGK